MNRPDKPGKILVVDDNPANIQVIGSILREAKYEVGFAMNGRKALDLLHDSGDYDIVLLDIKMPVLDGFEVCRIMQEDERLKEIPVIFLSASHDTETIISGFDTGAVDYVTKPFNSKELLARVKTHVELKLNSRRVSLYTKQLETLIATKDKFFSIISHDLRDPFEGILLICRTILKELDSKTDEEIIKQVEMLKSAAENGNSLLENLMTWSRSQTGRIAYQPAELPLETIMNRCIQAVSSQATAKNIRVITDLRENFVVRTDEAMFRHILRNLLTNAIKFTPPQGTITVHAQKNQGIVSISVTDTGIGITKSDRERLFRIDGNITSRRGTGNETGSGLGLILCKEFADKMDGTISVDSEPGKGSRFTFTIPAASR